MSTPTKPRIGRPPTGVTKVKPGLTIDRKIVLKAKKVALKQNMSLSAYVERAIVSYFEDSREATI